MMSNALHLGSIKSFAELSVVSKAIGQARNERSVNKDTGYQKNASNKSSYAETIKRRSK